MRVSHLLRKLKVLQGPFPDFNTSDVPLLPHHLFEKWLKNAIDHGVQEPHAMTISTVDEDGNPDARVLILKKFDDEGWYFASGANSRKGKQLRANPNVALTFYWPAVGRQVRVCGHAVELQEEDNAKDFLARGKIARATALLGKQSQVLSSRNVFDEALKNQVERIESMPELVDPHWTLYKVIAKEVEFWQGDEERKHIRLRYRLAEKAWLQELLWP